MTIYKAINMGIYTRRNFVKTSVLGGAAITLVNPSNILFSAKEKVNELTFVGVSSGDDRADMVFRALKPFSGQIRKAIGNRRVVIKPNNVLIYVPLACTHVETLEGISWMNPRSV